MENISKTYADAWSINQGNYSESLAKKIAAFIKLQKLNINTALDICCGSGNFLNELQRYGIACTGTEILDSYISYNSSKYPNIKFIKTNSIIEFDNVGKFDLISCNHDVLNMLSTIDEWNKFFELAYKHLNNGGILLFDYYTKKKLNGWNEIIFDESDKIDYIKEVKSHDGYTSINNIFYTNINFDENENQHISAIDRNYEFNNYNKKFKKTEDMTNEYYFENENILNLIKQNGYRYLITTDGSLSPVQDISNMNRVHIIAIKREG